MKVAAQVDRRTATTLCGAIAQLGERIVRNDEVVGSIPTSSTKFPIITVLFPDIADRLVLAAASCVLQSRSCLSFGNGRDGHFHARNSNR